MKLLCSYCNSYIDVEENTKCPNCGAPLIDALKEEEKKMAERQKAEKELELEKEKLRLKAEEDEKFMTLGAGIAAVALGSAVMSDSGKGRIIKKAVKNIMK